MTRVPKLLLGLAVAIAVNDSSQAQDFYKDKTVTIIVGYSPGGSFDLSARVLARYIGRYLPGNPTRIVENMTGAGGIIAANHLYNRVKPDGFTIGAWASPLILQHIMGNEAVQFDGRRFGYLGIPSEYDTVCTFNQQSGITKMDDWINAKRPQKISTIGPGTSTSDIPKLLKAALNLPMDWRWSPAKSTVTAAPGAPSKPCGARLTRARKSFPCCKPRPSRSQSTNISRWRAVTPKRKKRAS